jgi:tetratricopeptide (TPR) repeat protein
VTRALGVLVLLFALPVQAAPRKPPPPHDPRQEKAAHTHFDAAEKAFNVGRFEDALAEYQLAYDALPLPAFVFNIAQCHRNLGNSEQAIFFYQRYLSLEPEASNRGVVEDLIIEQQHRLDQHATALPPPQLAAPVELDAPPPGATLPAADLHPALTAAPPDRPPAGRSRLSPRWWLFGALGVALLGGVTVLAIRNSGSLPTGKLGAIDAR